MEGIDPQFLVYVVILAIVAVSTLVKKAIEKSTRKPQEGGKQISLRDAVREQLRRYMETNEAPGGPPFPPGYPRPTPPAEPAAPARPERPALDEAKGAAAPPPEPPPLPSAAGEHEHAPIPPATSPSRARMRSGAELRKAIVLAEILGPPVAERESDRLF